MPDYLHYHKDFSKLLEIIASDMGIIPQLIEKDYWIMHVLYGLKKQGFEFQLKGGTSLLQQGEKTESYLHPGIYAESFCCEFSLRS